jgi:transcriptional regulator with XRE-family HTH domain
MKSVSEIVVSNLVKLRKKNGLTQIELSQKINYSDKAISRWENGEVIPSIDVLEKLADIYQVNITYFFEEHLEEYELKIEERKFNLRLCIMFSLILIVWTVAVLTFVTIHRFFKVYNFKVLIWALPITMFVIRWCCRYYFNNKFYLITSSFGCWLTIIAIYLQFIHLNLWPVFIFGVPVQLTIILFNFFNKINKPKKKHNTTAEKIEKLFTK